jgi:hypothetical protein
MGRSTIFILALSVWSGGVGHLPVAVAEDATGVSAVAAVHGEGSWQTSQKRDLAPAGQRWNADALRLSDGELRGQITVAGSPLISSANVEGRVSGRGLSGRLLDDEGRPLAYFEGVMSARGASGRYRDKEGGEGDWYWEGRPGL